MKYKTIQEKIEEVQREASFLVKTANFLSEHAEILDSANAIGNYAWSYGFAITVEADSEVSKKIRAYFTQRYNLSAPVWKKSMGEWGAQYSNEVRYADYSISLTIQAPLPPTCHLEYEEVLVPERVYKKAVVKCTGVESEVEV